ncbi:MAG: TIGR03809 family protein [Bradyrhizobium sp.]
MTHRLDVTGGREVVARWCTLAERRLEYLTELFETGRWRRFHSESAFLENIHEAKAAVKIWRDLLSREASRNNRAIDMSWLARTTAAVPRGEIWRDRVQMPQPAQIPAQQPRENAIVPQADPICAEEAPSVQATEEEAAELTQKLVAIVERYPLLRNTF